MNVNNGKQSVVESRVGIGVFVSPLSCINNTVSIPAPPLCPAGSVPVVDSNVFTPVKPARVTECIEVWKAELKGDWNENYLIDGLSKGFSIIDVAGVPKSTFRRNYKSTSMNKLKVEARIKEEISAGNYVLTSIKPSVISALGAIPKDADDVRVIHDLSRPDGGVNKWALDTSVTYTSIDKVTEQITEGSYLATVDLRAAYRSIPINPSCYDLTGIMWKFEGDLDASYLFDSRLPFGASKSCAVFQSVTDSVSRIMGRKGYRVYAYLDDMICVGVSQVDCQACFDTLIRLIEDLGLVVNWKKVSQPVQYF